MKIGVEIPSDSHGCTIVLFICCVSLFVIASGRNFEYLYASWFFLLSVVYVLYRSFVVSRHYTIDETGITAHYWGMYHLHHSWDYFGDVGTYTVLREIEGPVLLIVFSKKQWAKYNQTRFTWRFEFFPFSAFYIVYTSERFEEIKKFCPRITYRTDEREQRYDLPYEKKRKRKKKTKE